jgi:hypothetical protein
MIIKEFIIFSVGGTLLLSAGHSSSARAAQADPWQASIDAAKKERFIPVELWTGAQWDGGRELAMKGVDATYGYRKIVYLIKGPVEWKHPVTGATYQVYERLNPGSGDKKQLFTVNEEKSGLGRVYDTRVQFGLRTFTGGLKFPLGVWKEGETRVYSYRHFSDKRDDQRETTRTEALTLRRIDFAYGGAQHCIDFDWKLTGEGEKVIDRNNYIYCPGRSMAGEGWRYRSPD